MTIAIGPCIYRGANYTFSVYSICCTELIKLNVLAQAEPAHAGVANSIMLVLHYSLLFPSFVVPIVDKVQSTTTTNGLRGTSIYIHTCRYFDQFVTNRSEVATIIE
jgi:hypothetical protein